MTSDAITVRKIPTRSTQAGEARQAFTFVGDSNFTWVNYPSVNSLTYRQEARLHNAHRRVRKRDDRLRPRYRTITTSSQPETRPAVGSLQLPRQQLSHRSQLDLSLAELDLNRKTLLSDRFHLLEDIWRNVFHDHFFLPNTNLACPLIRDPQLEFLSIAHTSWRDYRNTIIQPVITSEAKKGQQAMDVIWRNQALIVQDFRCLTEKFSGPGLVLSKEQFQQVFSAAFASIIHCIAFKQEEEYNAILEVNFALMATPQNRCVKQLPTAEWLRMLLPRPPESYDRSPAYQLEMLRKVELVLDFVAEVQAIVVSPSEQRATRSYHGLVQLVSKGLPTDTVTEPYPNFYSVCLHRILFLLHIHLNEQKKGDDAFLTTLNEAANVCLKYPPPSHLTLFLWTFLHQCELSGECRDTREPYFHWAMRDLIAVYKLSFLDLLTSSFLRRLGNDHIQTANTTTVDIPELRRMLRANYSMGYRSRSEVAGTSTIFDETVSQRLSTQGPGSLTIVKEESNE